MERIARIVWKDFSNYESGRSNNGGQYGFFEEYTYLPEEDRWLQEFFTTAEFEYCSSCGGFTQDHCNSPESCKWHPNCGDCDKIPCPPAKITSTELVNIILAHLFAPKAALWCEDSYRAILIEYEDGTKHKHVIDDGHHLFNKERIVATIKRDPEYAARLRRRIEDYLRKEWPTPELAAEVLAEAALTLRVRRD